MKYAVSKNRNAPPSWMFLRRYGSTVMLYDRTLLPYLGIQVILCRAYRSTPTRLQHSMAMSTRPLLRRNDGYSTERHLCIAIDEIVPTEDVRQDEVQMLT